METPRTPLLFRLMPSLTDVIFLLPVVFLFLRMDGAPIMLEGDTGWHLRTGQWILNHRAVPHHDMFSFTRPGEPWYAWEWLWDVAFGWVFTHGGMTLVVWLSLLILCATSAMVFRLTRRLCPNLFLSGGMTVLAISLTSIHWLARPHLLTMLLTVMSLWILEWHRTGERKLLWVLPLMTIPWVNLHGGFFVLYLLLASYIAGEFLAGIFAVSSDQRAERFRATMPYLLTLAASVAASFVNPYTYHLHQHIAQYLGDSESPFFKFVGEWQSISFRTSVGRYLELLIVLMVAASVQHLRKGRFTYPVLMAGWMHLALMSGRNIPLFGLVSAPFVAWGIYEALQEVARSPLPQWWRRVSEVMNGTEEEFRTIDSIPRFHVGTVVVVGLVLAAMYAPAAPERFRADFPFDKYPRKVLDKLPASEFTENVFTVDEWGDYLIYRYPETVKVFVDGRFDFYGGEHTQKYLDVLSAKHDWAKTLASHKVKSILLPVDTPLSSVLKESQNWTPVYDDGVSILFHSRGLLAQRRREQVSAALRAAGKGRKTATSPGAVEVLSSNPNL